jgi:hypothetical protein
MILFWLLLIETFILGLFIGIVCAVGLGDDFKD